MEPRFERSGASFFNAVAIPRAASITLAGADPGCLPVLCVRWGLGVIGAAWGASTGVACGPHFAARIAALSLGIWWAAKKWG